MIYKAGPFAIGVALLAGLCGCSHHAFFSPSAGDITGVGALGVENPLYVPIADHEFVWNQVVDEVEDYFKI